MNLICHLRQKWQSFHFHLHFHHETPCQAWVGSKASFSPERRPSCSAVCRGLRYPSSHSSLSPQTGPVEPGSDWLCALACVILCSRVMSPWLTITAHSVLLFSPEPLNGSLAFNKTAEPAPNSALTPLSLSRFLTLPVSASYHYLSIFLVDFAVSVPELRSSQSLVFVILITTKDV